MAAARACSLARASRAARLARSPAPLVPPGLLARLRRPWPPLGRSSPELARALCHLAGARLHPHLAAARRSSPAPSPGRSSRPPLGPSSLAPMAPLGWSSAVPSHGGPELTHALLELALRSAADEPHGSMSARRGHLRPAGHRDGGSADGRGRRPAACGAEVAGDTAQWRARAGAMEGEGRSRGGRGHNRGRRWPE
jgi:hypothetical protein